MSVKLLTFLILFCPLQRALPVVRARVAAVDGALLAPRAGAAGGTAPGALDRAADAEVRGRCKR